MGLNLLMTIINRSQTGRFIEFYTECGLSQTMATVARGTAASEMLDYFGLEDNERTVLLSFVTDENWKPVRTGLRRKMQIEAPGAGVAFTIPLCSIGGRKQLQFLTENQDFDPKEESVLQGTKHELLVVIANQGYTEMIMDAAREMGAGGGTVIHAKGTGAERAQQFLGVSLAAEKELVFIVTRSDQKNGIMKAIMDKAGLSTKAKSIVFSLPVTDTAGMRLIEADEEEQ